MKKRIKALEAEVRALRRTGWTREAKLTEQIINVETGLDDLRRSERPDAPDATGTAPDAADAPGDAPDGPEGETMMDRFLAHKKAEKAAPDGPDGKSMIDRELDRLKAEKAAADGPDGETMIDRELDRQREERIIPDRNRVIVVWECDTHEAFLPSDHSAVYDTGQLIEINDQQVVVMDSLTQADRLRVRDMLKQHGLIA